MLLSDPTNEFLNAGKIKMLTVHNSVNTKFKMHLIQLLHSFIIPYEEKFTQDIFSALLNTQL